MNLKLRTWASARLAWCAAFGLLAGLTPLARAATIWNGPLITYQQPGTNPTQSANQDRLTDNVWITRASRDRLFNAKTETFCSRGSSPTDTEWASGNLTDFASLTYTDFSSWVDSLGGGNVNPKIFGKPAVVHLISDDIYLSVEFSAWGAFGSGHFTYQRSTPAVVVPPSPTVSISHPANGAVFAAPANVAIAAAATVDGGSVTNVAFFGNNALLGSAQATPFSITASNLPAGAYALSAVATATGISSTSSVVNITIISPVAVSLSAPKVADNQFSFDYTVNPGLSYVILSSSNLVDWLPLLTNAPASNPAHFTDAIIPTGLRYYRIGRLPTL